MGICIIEAPSEGEAQASFLCQTNNDIYAVASQDYDSLLFKTKRLIQNLTLARRRKTISGYVEVKPLLIELEKNLNELEINQEQLICIGIMVGTDYNPKGIPGIGQKKALQIVKELKTKEKIFEEIKKRIENIEEKEKFEPEEIYSLFENHETKEEKIIFPKINKEKIIKILIERHNFSEERVLNQIEKLEKIEESKKQTGLNKWF